ncbi:rubredoxin [Mycolicibacterium sp. 120270]|uniref:rubredoxin n=1 Tax=Mycolicibacterium sp. 120270 TaxID=3090600 RepID=UPI00299E6ACE|nr:rubredoxin [Mycolicibacterium sp. 120270]MDX1884843.1 rubredoxin [Mycolicibacterium sp. 120270]
MASAQCLECGYIYDENAGNLREGFPAGTPWSSVPDDWNCPDCGVRDKLDFVIPGAELKPCGANLS